MASSVSRSTAGTVADHHALGGDIDGHPRDVGNAAQGGSDGLRASLARDPRRNKVVCMAFPLGISVIVMIAQTRTAAGWRGVATVRRAVIVGRNIMTITRGR